jgi:hypothetical protein
MNQTNFFKMLGRVRKGEVVRLNVGVLVLFELLGVEIEEL